MQITSYLNKIIDLQHCFNALILMKGEIIHL